MPYREGETPAQTAKIDRCIKKVMAGGKDRSSATAICIAQVHDKADEEVGEKMLKKQFTAEFKALKVDEGGKPGDFEAIVAVYDNVDRQGDRIKAGAFDETLEAWRKSGDPIPIVLAHGWDDPWKHIGFASPDNVKSIPGRGLYAKGHLDIDDNPLAKQVHRLMERRTLKEFSFGYRIPDGGERKASDGAYDLLALDLIEFGPCLKGVNEETELLAIKSELEAERRREAGEEPTIEDRLKAVEEALNKGNPIDDGKAYVTIDGTLEDRQKAVRAALSDEYSGDNTWADIEGTFADRVVFCVNANGESKSYQASYSIDDEGVATLTDIIEVEVEAVVTPKADPPIFDAAKADHDRAEEEAYAEKAERDAGTPPEDLKSADIDTILYTQGLDNLEASIADVLNVDPDIEAAKQRLDDNDV